MPLKKLKKPVIASILILTLLTACGPNLRATESFCQVYEPIYMSKADTEKTKQQIDRNNAAWMEICDGAVAR